MESHASHSNAIVKPITSHQEDFSATLNDDDDASDIDLPSPLLASSSHSAALSAKYVGYGTKIVDLDDDESITNLLIRWLKDVSDFVLEFMAPIIWCVLFVIIMDQPSLKELWYMPFLGVAAAFLANSVPIGGGIVYIPVLHLLGVNVKLGVSFTVATMTFGNGILGFLRWLKKNSALIIWESFPFTVLSSSLGTLIAIYFTPKPDITSIKRLFGGFCVSLALFVGYAARNGGISRTLTPLLNSITSYPNRKLNFDSNQHPRHRQSSSSSSSSSSNDQTDWFKWTVVSIISFLAGFILVPNIGVGPALTTYVILELYGYDAEQSIVTGIITGGWVCVVPFLIHWIQMDDVPWKMWIMVLPGVYIGSKYAPLAHSYIGIENILTAFALFLLGTSYIFLFDV